MNIAMLLAFLVASGVCAETSFIGADGSELKVVVCPRMNPAPAESPVPEERPKLKEIPVLKEWPVLEEKRALEEKRVLEEKRAPSGGRKSTRSAREGIPT